MVLITGVTAHLTFDVHTKLVQLNPRGGYSKFWEYNLGYPDYALGETGWILICAATQVFI